MSAFRALSERVVIIASSSPRPSLALSTPYTCNFISINALLWLTPLLCNLGYPNVLELTITTILHHPCQHYPHLPLPSRPPFLTISQNLSYTTPQRRLGTQRPRKTYRNGYESKRKTPSYTPYKLNNPRHPRQKAFAFSNFQRLSAMESISPQRWNELAISKGVLKVGQRLRDSQVEASNVILSRQRDLCVIAPTGAGKSLLWVLPLLAQKKAISVVVIPCT
jgi:hypothetical protein